MDVLSIVLVVVFVLFSSIIHEVMHGLVADRLGDPTARYAGRLTLNPIPHIDLFGSIILPILTFFSIGVAFGYAKPVPYNPYNLRPGRWSEAMVAGAGPASNFVLALIGGVLIRSGFFGAGADLIYLFVVVNVALFCLNLIPVPPIDGSKVLEALLPLHMRMSYGRWRRQMEYNPFIGMIIILILVLVLGGLWGDFILNIANVISGL